MNRYRIFRYKTPWLVAHGPEDEEDGQYRVNITCGLPRWWFMDINEKTLWMLEEE